MNNWITKPFRDIATFPPKVSLEKEHFFSFIPMDVVNEGYKYVSPKEFKKWTGSGGAKFENGDTLFARITPCLQNGKIAQAKNLPSGKGFGSTEFFVFRGKENVSDSDFIYYLAKTDDFRSYAIGSMVGASGRQRADATYVGNYEVNLPPLPTQKRIASILSAYDDLIENNLKRIKLLEESIQLVYEITSNHKDVKEKLVYPEYCNFIKGSEPGSDNYTDNNIDKNTPFLRVGDLGARNSEIFVDSKLNGLKFTKKDDILVSLDGTIGIVRIGMEGAYSSGIRKVVCNNSLIKGFTYAFLKSRNGQNQIKTYAKGSTILHASSAIPKLKFRIAINSDTEVLLNELNSMLVLIINLTEQNDKLKQSRDILLPRLMSGTINVES